MGATSFRRKLIKARAERLRAQGTCVVDNGRSVEPGSREYERALRTAAESASDDELLLGKEDGS